MKLNEIEFISVENRSVNNNPIAKVGHFMATQNGPASKRHDTFCWSCHCDGQVLECHECPRVFHHRCVQHHSTINSNWLCPECVAVRNAEKHNRLSLKTLRDMLTFAMERIKTVVDSQPFLKPVDTSEFPHYGDYIIYPIDISHLEGNIKKKGYTSTRAFLADFRWILHNCIVFNSTHSKLTNTARTLMKVIRLLALHIHRFFSIGILSSGLQTRNDRDRHLRRLLHARSHQKGHVVPGALQAAPFNHLGEIKSNLTQPNLT